MLTRITNRTLLGALDDPDTVILDIRPTAAFNGWILQNEERGGHIPGAIPFPGKWLANRTDEDVVELLASKGVTPQSHVIITSYSDSEMQTVAGYLQRLGFRSIAIHANGMHGWAADPRKQMQQLSRYKHLVHPDWLNQVLNGEKPDDQIGDHIVLAHVNFDNWGDYNQGHIRRAIWLDTLELEEEEQWNCRPKEELAQAVQHLGIRHDSTVILYGRTGKPDMSQEKPGREAGQIAAMRAALLLLYIGVKDVRILDGGLDAWQSAGYAVTTEEFEPTPVEAFGIDIPAHPDYIVDTPKAKDMLASTDAELVSVRSWPEFIGEVSGYHYVLPRGRIPGAIFGNCGTDAYHMENYRNPDNTLRNYHEIASEWRDKGIVPEKHIAFYCGTGWRASEAFFSAWLMGWPRVSIYDGGWYVWSSDPDNPVETGIPAEQPNPTEY